MALGPLRSRVTAIAAALDGLLTTTKPAVGSRDFPADSLLRDQALRALVTETDRLDAATLTHRGQWAANTTYAVNDLYTLTDGSTLRVTTGHVSGTTAPTVVAPGANATVFVAAGAPGLGHVVEVSQTTYDGYSAAQRAAAIHIIVADTNNLAADTQSLLNAGNLDRFAMRGTGGALSATTVDGIGAVLLTSVSSSASRDLGVGTTVAVTPGRSYAVGATMRHQVKWDASMRVDVIWRTSADAAISSVTGTERTLPSVGADLVLSQPTAGPAPSNAASMEVRVRGASNTVAPSLNGAISVRNVTVTAL